MNETRRKAEDEKQMFDPPKYEVPLTFNQFWQHLYVYRIQNKHYRPHIVDAGLMVETFGVSVVGFFFVSDLPKNNTSIVCVSKA